MIPYEAYINYTGDVQIKVKGETHYDYDNLYPEFDNYDIVLEDREVTTIVGAMTKEQYNRLVQTEDLIDLEGIIND